MTGKSLFSRSRRSSSMPSILRHLDVEHGEVGRVLGQRLQRRLAVRIEAGDEAFRLQRDRQRGQDVAVVVDQRDGDRHWCDALPLPGRALAKGGSAALPFDAEARLRYARGMKRPLAGAEPSHFRGITGGDQSAVFRSCRIRASTRPRPCTGISAPPSWSSSRAPRRGHARQGRPAGRRDRQAHRPLGQGQVHRPRRRDGKHDLVGQQRLDRRPTISPRSRPISWPRWRRRRLCSSRTSTAARSPSTGCNVRVINELAWHSLFIRTLLVRPAAEELAGFEPEFTIIDLPSFRADPARHGTALGDGDRGQPDREADPDRRHRLCRRDEEVGVRHPQLSAAAATA